MGFQKGMQGLSPERRAMTATDLQKALDTAMKLKAEVGLCKGKAMDECAAYKAKEYPKQTQKIMGLMSKVQANVMKGTPMFPSMAPAALPKLPTLAAAPPAPKPPKLGLLAALAAAKKKKEEPKPTKPPAKKLGGLLAALAAKKAGKKYDDNMPVQEGLPAAKHVGIFIASGLLSGAVVAGAALLVQRRRQHNTADARLIAE